MLKEWGEVPCGWITSSWWEVMRQEVSYIGFHQAKGFRFHPSVNVCVEEP